MKECKQDVDTALKRLKWVISKRKNEEDITAFNSILGYIEALRGEHLNGYNAFAKLFLWIFQAKARFQQDEKRCLGRKENINARGILAEIQSIIEKPIDWHIEDLMTAVPYIRFEMLYKDYDQELRQAKSKAQENKIPAEQSITLCEQYQSQDLENVVKARNQRLDQLESDLLLAITKPYTREQAEYFLRSEVQKLLLISG